MKNIKLYLETVKLHAACFTVKQDIGGGSKGGQFWAVEHFTGKAENVEEWLKWSVCGAHLLER